MLDHLEGRQLGLLHHACRLDADTEDADGGVFTAEVVLALMLVVKAVHQILGAGDP